MHRLIISLTDELWQALRREGYETGLSYTEVVRRALVKYFEEA